MSITPRRVRQTPEVHLSRVAQRIKGTNPIVSILLDMFEKALHKGPSRENTDISRIYNQFIVGKIPIPVLKRVVNNYNALPESVRRRIPPQRAAPLPVVQRGRMAPVKLHKGALSPPTPSPVPENLSPLAFNLGLAASQVNTFPSPVQENLSPLAFKVDSTASQVNNFPSVQEKLSPLAFKLDLTARQVNSFPFDSAYSAKALATLGEIVKAPAPNGISLDSIQPKLSNGYSPGQSIKLTVRSPADIFPFFKVVLSKKAITESSGTDEYASLTPTVLKKVDKGNTSTVVLSVTLPENFETGFVQVTGNGVVFAFPIGLVRSNALPIQQKLSALPTGPVSPILLATPAITSVKPKSQFPGMKVIIEGTNLGAVKVVDSGKRSNGSPQTNASSMTIAHIVTLIPSSTQLGKVSLPVTVLKASPVDGLGQLQITIPPDCVPGGYSLQVEVGQGSGGGVSVPGGFIPPKYPNGETSLAFDFEVRAHKYKVTFDTILCDDESDNEFFGQDEIVTSWTVVADDKAWGKSTGEYGGFEDGKIQSYTGPDSSVFVTDGSFGDVKIALSIRTDLYESDSSDVAATQTALAATAKASAAVGELLIKLGQPTAGAIALAAAAVAEAANILAGLFGGLNNLGSLQSTWTAKQLQMLTENPAHQFTDQKLPFLNDDDTGSYTLSYTVSRLNVG